MDFLCSVLLWYYLILYVIFCLNALDLAKWLTTHKLLHPLTLICLTDTYIWEVMCQRCGYYLLSVYENLITNRETVRVTSLINWQLNSFNQLIKRILYIFKHTWLHFYVMLAAVQRLAAYIYFNLLCADYYGTTSTTGEWNVCIMNWLLTDASVVNQAVHSRSPSASLMLPACSRMCVGVYALRLTVLLMVGG